MINQLPVSCPPITCYDQISLPLSVIMATPHIQNWFCSELIQLYLCEDENGNLRLKFYNYGIDDEYEPLEYLTFPDLMKISGDTINIFKNFIENGYYIIITYDYVGTDVNAGNDKRQRILLYGIDDKQQIFNACVCGELKYKQISISFDDIAEVSKYRCASNLNETTLVYKLKDYTYDGYHVNLGKIKWHLTDYLYSVDTIARERVHLRTFHAEWGLNIYEKLKNDYYPERKINPSILTNAYCLYEHKKNLINQLIYIDKHSDLKCSDEIFDRLVMLGNQADVYKDLVVEYNKSNHSNDREYYNSIIKSLDDLKETEKINFENYYNYNKAVFESF